MEQFLLIALLIRPTLDFWRDFIVLQGENWQLNFNAVLSLVVFLGLAFLFYKYRPAKLQKQEQLLLGLGGLFLLWSALSFFWSVDKIQTLIETLKIANLFLLFFVSYFWILQNKTASKQLFKIVFWSAIPPIILAILQFFLGTGLNTFGLNGRIYGTLGHPNVFALFILVLFILTARREIVEGKKNNWLYVFLVILLTLTYTRASFIGLLIFISTLGILKYRRLLIQILSTLAIFYLLFYPLNNWLARNQIFYLQQIPIINRLTTINEDADSLSWRTSIVKESQPMIRAKLLTGWGMGTFQQVWEENRPDYHFWDDSSEAHNDYLRLGLELGLPGISLYILFFATLLYLSFISWYKNKNHEALILFSWIVTFAIMNLSENMLHHTPVMWVTWAAWGALLGNLKIKK